jgi:hypothetical protein
MRENDESEMNGGNDEDIEQVLSMFDFTANSIH